MIHEGWNILRFTRAEKSRELKLKNGGFGTIHKFHAVNIANDEVIFAYLVPKNAKPHGIIADLEYLTVSKVWIDVDLKEEQRMWRIIRMKEVKTEQQKFIDEQRMRGWGRIQ